jgi:hypothetical protein
MIGSEEKKKYCMIGKGGFLCQLQLVSKSLANIRDISTYLISIVINYRYQHMVFFFSNLNEFLI